MHSGRECPCYVRKILGFYDGCWKHWFFWQPMQDFGCAHINYRRLHEILTQVGWRWSDICRFTAQVAVFFFQNLSPSLIVIVDLLSFLFLLQYFFKFQVLRPSLTIFTLCGVCGFSSPFSSHIFSYRCYFTLEGLDD